MQLKSITSAKQLFRRSREETATGSEQLQAWGAKYHPLRAFNRLQQLLTRFQGHGPALASLAPAVGHLPAPSGSHAGTQPASDARLLGTDGVLRKLLFAVCGPALKLWMTGLNTCVVLEQHHLDAALARPHGVPLITVSNHVTAIDDPVLMSSFIPYGLFATPQHIRYTLCATDRCFKYSALVPFFRAGKVVPIHRGAGLDQPGMTAAGAALASGGWVHVFPEGTRTRDGAMGRCRAGAAHLVAAASTPPVVLPFVHAGMEEVFPRGALLPRVGGRVQIMFGAPIPTQDLRQAALLQGWSRRKLVAEIRGRVEEHLRALHARNLATAGRALPETALSAQEADDSREPSTGGGYQRLGWSTGAGGFTERCGAPTVGRRWHVLPVSSSGGGGRHAGDVTEATVALLKERWKTPLRWASHAVLAVPECAAPGPDQKMIGLHYSTL